MDTTTQEQIQTNALTFFLLKENVIIIVALIKTSGVQNIVFYKYLWRSSE